MLLSAHKRTHVVNEGRKSRNGLQYNIDCHTMAWYKLHKKTSESQIQKRTKWEKKTPRFII